MEITEKTSCKRITTMELAKMALIIALYVAITLVFSTLSFGIVQIRLAEMFNFLAIYHKRYIGVVTLSVALANLLASPFGITDVLVGSLSTLFVLILVHYSSKYLAKMWQKYVLAILVISFSMFTIAGELVFLTHASFWASWWSIGTGEFISLCFGSVIMYSLSKRVSF